MRPRTLFFILAPLLLVGVLVAPTLARSDDEFRARLRGYQEVPSISTPASGRFRAEIGPGPVINFRLTYQNIQNVFMAHIHLGQRAVNGGISAFLCGPGHQVCPPTGGTVTGTITAADVIGPATQGIEAGEINELIAAMKAGVTYANVHTTDGVDTVGGNPEPPGPPGDFPAGEIRGQIEEDD
jgi:CHRD domain